jgi:2-polyprenyl-3-methyl-5-hydroxy-6-metoxy-1,4-benzoquinol methylase
MRILLVMLEFPVWLRARHWSYVANFAIEEGMRAQGIETVVLPAFQGIDTSDRRSWLSQAKQVLRGRQFDQVWLWLVHNDYDQNCLEYLASLAPVRVGWLGENLFYTPDEHSLSPELHERHEVFLRQVKALTHIVVAADEVEAPYVEREFGLPAIWWPTAVPLANIMHPKQPASFNQAVFCGSPYGMRKRFLQSEAVSRVLMTIAPPENAFNLPDVFNEHCANSMDALGRGVGTDYDGLTSFTSRLRELRQEIFTVWQKGLSRYSLIVNLPSYGKCYTSRVVEAMASGRPVCAWKVPDRPRNLSLFEADRDIFLFEGEGDENFGNKITEILKDPERLDHIAANARNKILAYHTSEIRVRQTLDWIETGTKPVYSDQELAAIPPSRQDQDFYVELFMHNQEWSAPDPNPDETTRWEAIKALLAKALNGSPGRPGILEIGSGRGWLGERLAAFGDYLGIEPVSAVVDRARELFPQREFMVGTLSDLPEGRQFDVLVATEVIEHVPLNRQADFVAGLFARLRPGGACILTTPRAELFQTWRRIVAPQPTEFWFSEAGLEKMFTVQGFEPAEKRLAYKTMPKVFALDPVKDRFVAPDQVPLYQAWLFVKPDGQDTAGLETQHNG